MAHRRGICSVAVGVVIASIAALCASGVVAKPKGFKYGVTAADVTAKSAILWAKANRSRSVLAQISHKGGFGRCKASNAEVKVKAKSGHDNTLRAEIEGLKPDTSYTYRFCTENGARSAKGRFTTAPSKNQNETIQFALSGDQDARPAPRRDDAVLERLRRLETDRPGTERFQRAHGRHDLFRHRGPGLHARRRRADQAAEVGGYKTNLGMKPWTKARGSTAYYAHWDDHEFVNDFSRDESTFPLSVGDVNIDGETLYKRGVKAFQDYNPTTYSEKTGIYRSVRWGKNLEVFFLDERWFRSSSSDYGGLCDNPPGSGNPDLAPTAPQSTRNAFSPIVAAARQPALAGVPGPRSTTRTGRCSGRSSWRSSSSRSEVDGDLQGDLQRGPDPAVLRAALRPLGGLRGGARGAPALPTRNVENVVFLTTDVHANLVNDARYRPSGRRRPELRDLRHHHRPDRNRQLSEEINERDRQPQRRHPDPRRVPQASAAERGRNALRGDGPVQLRPGRGLAAASSRSTCSTQDQPVSGHGRRASPASPAPRS